MIFKTTKKENGNIGLGTNFGNIKEFFTRQNILSNSDISAIKAYNKEIHACTGSQTAFMRTMQGASDKAKDLVQQANGNVVALGNLTRASKAAAIGMKALSIAGNMLVSMAVIKGIELLATSISDYVNAAKIARENAEALSSSLTESQNKYTEDSKKIGELSSRYETLSKDVNHLGQNVSLSSSQYDEYKSIIKQISEIMPDLTLRFNEQGEAIGFVDGKLADVNEKYQEYQKNQAHGFTGVKQAIEEYKDSLAKYEE